MCSHFFHGRPGVFHVTFTPVPHRRHGAASGRLARGAPWPPIVVCLDDWRPLPVPPAEGTGGCEASGSRPLGRVGEWVALLLVTVLTSYAPTCSPTPSGGTSGLRRPCGQRLALDQIVSAVWMSATLRWSRRSPQLGHRIGRFGASARGLQLGVDCLYSLDAVRVQYRWSIADSRGDDDLRSRYRNLAAVRRLNEEALRLLCSLPARTEEQIQWIDEILQTRGTPPTVVPCLPVRRTITLWPAHRRCPTVRLRSRVCITYAYPALTRPGWRTGTSNISDSRALWSRKTRMRLSRRCLPTAPAVCSTCGGRHTRRPTFADFR